jgi:hypothetical protein
MTNRELERPTRRDGDLAEVELVIVGDHIVPSVISSNSALVPSRAWAKGEQYASRSGQTLRKHTGVWAITKGANSVEAAANELLGVVETRMAEIRLAASQANARIGVGIWWEPEAGQGGFTVSSEVMKRLSELGERVDIYFPA